MNKHIYLRFCFCIGILTLGLNLTAQNIKEDIRRINENYFNASAFQQEVFFQLFASYEAKEALESYTVFTQKEGSSSYSRRGKVESLSNDKITLVVDHGSKAIMLQGPSPEQTKINAISEVQLDSMLNLCKNTQFESKKGKLGVYHFYFKAYAYDQVSVEFNRSDFLIQKLTLYSRSDETSMRVEISYRNIRKQINFPKDTFSESRFLVLKSGNYSVKDDYSDYQLLNYLSK